jgi:hypothetical protein
VLETVSFTPLLIHNLKESPSPADMKDQSITAPAISSGLLSGLLRYHEPPRYRYYFNPITSPSYIGIMFSVFTTHWINHLGSFSTPSLIVTRFSRVAKLTPCSASLSTVGRQYHVPACYTHIPARTWHCFGRRAAPMASAKGVSTFMILCASSLVISKDLAADTRVVRGCWTPAF